MFKSLLPILALALIVSSCSKSSGTLYVTGELNSANQVPTNSSYAIGLLSGTYDDDTNILKLKTTFSSVITPTAGHIHEGAAGVNGPVLFDLGINSGLSPFNFTSPALTTEQETALRNGELYVNLHSVNFPNGEIRGQIVVKENL